MATLTFDLPEAAYAGGQALGRRLPLLWRAAGATPVPQTGPCVPTAAPVLAAP
jgi:hypothetical protein